MGFKLSKNSFNSIVEELSKDYIFFAPKVIEGEGRFSDTDVVRYGEIKDVNEIELNQKSAFSFKEIVLPISQTLFYYTEDEVVEPKGRQKGAIVFLRACDLHSVKRLDEIYLNNGVGDYYYNELRKNLKFALIGCEKSYDNCFCVSAGTNKAEDYDLYFDIKDEEVKIISNWEELNSLIEKNENSSEDITVSFVEENNVKVEMPEEVDLSLFDSDIWDEYNARCIACGRCNFVCPTCTCYTMQDIFYEDNANAGERRRVWASCHVDGYTDMAGGHGFRTKHGQRMRFKVLHKVYDYRKRFGYNMCVGCGRCDDICPEYISFSNSINKLTKASKEVK